MADLAADRAFQRAETEVFDALEALGLALAKIDTPRSRVRNRRSEPFAVDTLTAVEERVQAYVLAHRSLLDIVAPRTGRRRVVSPDYEDDRSLILPFLRIAIGVGDLLRLAVVHASTEVGDAWGTHLLNTDDVSLSSYVPLELRGLSGEATSVLLPEVAADIVEAVADAAAAMGPWGIDASDRVRAALDTASSRLARRPIGVPIALTLFTAEEFTGALGWTLDDLRAAVSRGEVLSVQTWDGQEAYPDFQLYRGAVNPVITTLVPMVTPTFTGWPRALWFRSRMTDQLTVVRRELEQINAWRPAFEGPDDRFMPTAPPEDARSVRLSDPLFRVARRGNEPFYFSGVLAAADAWRGGRWDLPPGSTRAPAAAGAAFGTMYLATTQAGAWAETLDRVPIVTLGDLLGRTAWSLTPLEADLKVIDLANIRRLPPEIWTEPRRARTQAIAGRAFARGTRGMRVRLRTLNGPKDLGVVLFGQRGASAPSTTGLGAWRIESSPAELDSSLWTYLHSRNRFLDLQYLLRRFPGDVTLLRRNH